MKVPRSDSPPNRWPRPRPRTRHIFTFDAADAGSATLHITLDENEQLTTSVDIELNDNAE